MDILNFISWIKGGRVVTTVDPAKTLLPVGLKDNKRDDGYLAGAISVADFAAQLVPPVPEPAYKVYTALLTQSGGNNFQSISSGSLTIGVTYQIISTSSAPGDFTNVGAPNNNVGTYFVATGTNPNEWGGYELEYNTGTPVVTVLENTIGNVWFERQGQGAYNCVCSGLFPEGKTFIIISALGRPLIFAFRYFNDNQIQIQTITTEYGNQEWDNEVPGNFEIRVYN